MWLSKSAALLDRIVRPISRLFHIVGVAVLALMMFLTAADVIGRYLFSRPIVGSFDLTEYMMAIVVAFTIAYCGVMKGHVRVELAVERLPKRAQAIVDSITGLLGLGLLVMITWRSITRMTMVYVSKSTSLVLLIPMFPFVGIVAFGSALFCLVLLKDLLEFLSQAVRK